MFVNGLAFMVSVSHILKFTTVEYMLRSMALVLSQSLVMIYELYTRRGFNIKLFPMDREFECLRKIMPRKLDLNTAAASKHVPDIEGQIWFLK